MMRKSRSWIFGSVAAVLACTAVVGGLLAQSAPAPAKPAPAAGAHIDERVVAVSAFLNKHCVACHNPEKKKADLLLHAYTDTPSILKGRKTFQQAIEMVHAGEMPPDGKKKPSADEIETFAKAVQGIYIDAEKAAGPNPGRVTVRRLNKGEYNNTVRDLLGGDFSAADDFPADDIGHGFDNIGDVLTVSPVLMERYLGAAEMISNSAIALELPKAPRKWQGNRYLEPAGSRVPTTRFRPVPKGSVNTPFKLSADGDYVLKTKVWGKTVDGESVKANVLVDGKQVTSAELPTEEKKALVIEHKLTLPPGEHRFAVEIANPSEGAVELDVGGGRRRREGNNQAGEAKPPENVRVLYVEYISLDGPADTRPAPHRKLVNYADPKAPKAEQTRQIMTKLATRAYRRPATKDEVDRLVQLVEQTEASGQSFEAGLQMAVQAVLVSPKFLFRLELDDRPESPQATALDEFQLASRLSYFIWSSMPDDELFDLAAKHQLTPNLEKQVRRMLTDPKSRSLVDNFAMQWLQLQRLKSYSPDTKMFPNFDEQLRNAMGKETELFVEAIIKEDRSILELLDADFTFLNDRLAKHYGIADTNGNPLYEKTSNGPRGERIPRDNFVRVSLPKGGLRGGLLTQASILSVTSNPTRTSPVKRGKWVLEQMLGAPPPPPPPNVPELEEDGKVATGSLRERLEEHRANPSCASCHAKMDPIGFAFENFDAVGAYRTKDGNFPIDSAGVMPDGSTFKDAGELRKMLVDKRKEQFTRALTEKLMIYGLGRGLEFYDDRATANITKAVAADGHKFSRLVIEIVKSDPFRKRRGLEDN